MGYGTNGLTFNTLRSANEARLPEFKDALGNICHEIADGSDWSPNDWAVAMVGEAGEACNVLKKVRRGDLTLEEAMPKLEQEFADVIIYMDLLAKRVGINLGEAVMETFNAKSVQVGSRVRLAADDWHYEDERAYGRQHCERCDKALTTNTVKWQPTDQWLCPGCKAIAQR